MLNTPTVLEVPAFDEHIRYGGCMQRSTSLALRAEGVEPPQLLGKYWRFIREWGPPFRNKASFAISEGAFHVFASKFDDSREALSRHGIDVVMCRGMGPVESWNRILDRLARGRPTPILLDNYHLKIHETFYQKIHGTHVFAVGGYDPEAGQVHVFNVRESVEDWQVPFDTVLEAWATEEDTWFDVLAPSELRPDTAAAVRDDIRACVGGMLPQHPGEHWARGVPAIRRFADELETYPSRFQAEEVRAFLEDGFHQLPGIREQRLLFGRALGAIGQRLALAPLSDIAVQVEQVGKTWSVARNWFLRAAEGDLGRGVSRLAAKLREVADAEERTLLTLAELCDSPTWPGEAVVGITLQG